MSMLSWYTKLGVAFSIVVYAIMLVDIGEGFWCSLLRLVGNQSMHITNLFEMHVFYPTYFWNETISSNQMHDR